MIKRMSFRSICCAASAIVGGAVLAGFPLEPAAAEVSDPFSGLTPLSSNDLTGLRGGFSVGAFDFDVGVVVSTAASSASGVFTVTTTASLNPAGLVTNARTDFSELPAQANAGGNGSPQTPATPPVVVPGQTGEPTAAAEPVVIAAPVTVGTTELADGGITVNMAGTDFSVVHEISSDQLVTLVQNTESGVSLSTSMDINITIENFSQVLDNVTRNMPLILNLGRDAGISSVQ